MHAIVLYLPEYVGCVLQDLGSFPPLAYEIKILCKCQCSDMWR